MNQYSNTPAKPDNIDRVWCWVVTFCLLALSKDGVWGRWSLHLYISRRYRSTPSNIGTWTRINFILSLHIWNN